MKRTENHAMRGLKLQGKQKEAAKISSPSLSTKNFTALEENDDTSEEDIPDNKVFQDLQKTLLAEILDPLHSRYVVTICGMGGLGKTTLAHKIYKSEGVVRHFHCRAWVSAPQPFDKMVLFKSILESLRNDSKENMVDMQETNMNEDLAGQIRMFLRGRRYLMVIDDVWEVDVWNILKTTLQEDNNGSRLIITTRRKVIAMQDESFAPHDLRFLTQEESWNLFCKNGFPLEKKRPVFPSAAEKTLAMEMLQACRGLALAVTVLANLLSEEKGLKAWYEVQEKMWEKLKSRSPEISSTFSLSYDHLPKELQRCLLYMAMFPEGYDIDAGKLMRLWVAGGFASNDAVAEDYIHELTNCSLVQVRGSLLGKIAKCRLHDLVRNLAIDKATKIGFFGVLDPSNHHSVFLSKNSLAVSGSLLNYISVSQPKTDISTLLFFKEDREYFTETWQLYDSFIKYRNIEVLDLTGINLGSNSGLIKELDVLLKNMCHIKFLGLANTSVTEIPSTIAMISKLQTLEAGGKRYRCRLPKEISTLKNLRHLLGRFEDPLPIEGLHELHTLKIIDSDQMHVLKSCINIKELVVCSIEKDRSHLDFVNCETVETLTIISPYNPLPSPRHLQSSSRLKRLWLHGLLTKSPNWDDLSSSLTSLILSNSRLINDPMEALEKLPCLNNLELKNSYIGEKIVCHQNGFTQLEVLRLCELYNLNELVVEEGAMPKLRGLGIFDCYKLRKPEYLKSVPDVPESAADYYLDKMING